MYPTFRVYRGKNILKFINDLLKEGNVVRSPEFGNIVSGLYGGSPEGIRIDPPAKIRGIGVNRLPMVGNISFTAKQQEKSVLIHLGTKYFEMYSKEKELNNAGYSNEVCEFISVDV
jgi:hypothetical protein